MRNNRISPSGIISHACSWIFSLILAPLSVMAQPALTPEQVIAAKAFIKEVETGKLICSLNPLINMPEVWALTPEKLNQTYPIPLGVTMQFNPYFRWLTVSQDRAMFQKTPFSNFQTELQFFGGELTAEEAVIDFIEGKINGISISLHNRGDSGEISQKEFQRRIKICSSKITALLQVNPITQKANSNDAIPSEGWIWSSKRGQAILQHNPEAKQGDIAYLRLKIAPKDAKGIFAATFQNSTTPVKLSNLTRNITTTFQGNTFIKNVPMVDQGPKGYCTAASLQRLFEYYGIPADQHQIAQIVDTDSKLGTNLLVMAQVLGKIDQRFKTRFKILSFRQGKQMVTVNEKKMTAEKEFSQLAFFKEIHRYIDQGIPLLWSLELGLVPEEPASAIQIQGGHTRMIVGYNDNTQEVLFSDSWGAGHELKKMTMNHAYQASDALFVIFPIIR